MTMHQVVEKPVFEDTPWGRGKVWRNEAGEIHRDGGPAIEPKAAGKSGTATARRIATARPPFSGRRERTQWKQFGEMHREDGPAEESPGQATWWWRGKQHPRRRPRFRAHD